MKVETQVIESEAFLRQPTVLQMVGLREARFRALVREGKFPKPIKISDRAIAWKESDVRKWMNEKIAAALENEQAMQRA